MRPNLNWRRAKASKNLGLQVKNATTVHVIQFQITGPVTHFNKRVKNMAKPMLHIKLCFQQNKMPFLEFGSLYALSCVKSRDMIYCGFIVDDFMHQDVFTILTMLL